MRAVVRVETLKLTRSMVGAIASLAIVVGAVALLCGITAGVAGGNPEVIAKAGRAGTRDWPGLLAGATQITAVVAVLGCGIVLAWMVGREFGEGTISGLFALPAGRGTIALGKLTVYALWAALVSGALALGVLALGLAFAYGPPDAETWSALGRLFVLGVLSAGLAAPVAWVATLARSVLAGVGCVLAVVIAAQVGALTGAGGWMPWATPALWALSHGTGVTAAQLGVALAVPVAFGLLTCGAWSRLQLDR